MQMECRHAVTIEKAMINIVVGLVVALPLDCCGKSYVNHVMYQLYAHLSSGKQTTAVLSYRGAEC